MKNNRTNQSILLSQVTKYSGISEPRFQVHFTSNMYPEITPMGLRISYRSVVIRCPIKGQNRSLYIWWDCDQSVWVASKNIKTQTLQKPNTVLVAVCHFPSSPYHVPVGSSANNYGSLPSQKPSWSNSWYVPDTACLYLLPINLKNSSGHETTGKIVL